MIVNVKTKSKLEFEAPELEFHDDRYDLSHSRMLLQSPGERVIFESTVVCKILGQEGIRNNNYLNFCQYTDLGKTVFKAAQIALHRQHIFKVFP